MSITARYVLLVMVLGALVACGTQPSARDRRLQEELARQSAGVGAGEPAASGSGTFRMKIGDSERESVETEPGSSWVAEVVAGKGDRFDLTVAAQPTAADVPVEVTVTHRAGGGEATLVRESVRPADGWVHFSLELPEGSGEVALSSTRKAVWAELYQLRAGEDAGVSGPPPNIVLVSLDTVRADHLSLYGYPRATSPNLDRFAADSWVFQEAYAAATWTAPSHASMFTGLLADQHGLRRVEDALAPAALTVAEVLRSAGYRTVAITDGGLLQSRWGMDQGFDRYDVTPGQAWEPKDAAVIFDRATRWVEDNRFRPFFLFVHTYEAHQPYENRDGFADPFLDPGYDGAFASRVDIIARHGRLDAADLPRVTALYDGGIRRADDYLGRFLRTLRRRGLLDSTAVIITSDHGEELLEHGGLEHTHGKVFQENLRVPLILRPPGGLPPGGGHRVTTAASGLDLFPTLLDLAGLDNGDLDGSSSRPMFARSLIELAAGPPEPERTILAQGLNSLLELNERRYRLDRGPRTLIFDRVRGTAERYRRDRDPQMLRSEPALDANGTGAGLVARLQTALSLLEPDAVSTRLPLGTTAVRLPSGGGLSALGVWSALSWRSATTGARVLGIEPDRPALMVFKVGRGPVAREVEVAAADGVWRRLRLTGPVTTRSALPTEELLSPGVLFRSVQRTDGTGAEVTPEQAAELRALGYL